MLVPLFETAEASLDAQSICLDEVSSIHPSALIRREATRVDRSCHHLASA